MWGPRGHGARGLRLAHPSEMSGSVRTEKRPLDLAILRSQVTWHHAFADLTHSVKQSPHCCHPWAPPRP